MNLNEQKQVTYFARKITYDTSRYFDSACKMTNKINKKTKGKLKADGSYLTLDNEYPTGA